jgi:uncharacterized RDD family membrane protein YckC
MTTGENVIGYRFAGFWWRVLAYLIDWVILWVAGAVVAFFFIGGGERDPEDVSRMVAVSSLIWWWLYFALFESSSLRGTLGKRACGLIVTDEEGRRISFARATGRYFAKILSGIILGIGFFMAGWTRKKQALHDLICDTLVLKEMARPEQVIPPQTA